MPAWYLKNESLNDSSCCVYLNFCTVMSSNYVSNYYFLFFKWDRRSLDFKLLLPTDITWLTKKNKEKQRKMMLLRDVN